MMIWMLDVVKIRYEISNKVFSNKILNLLWMLLYTKYIMRINLHKNIWVHIFKGSTIVSCKCILGKNMIIECDTK